MSLVTKRPWCAGQLLQPRLGPVRLLRRIQPILTRRQPPPCAHQRHRAGMRASWPDVTMTGKCPDWALVKFLIALPVPAAAYRFANAGAGGLREAIPWVRSSS
jgi:hypothetical protein